MVLSIVPPVVLFVWLFSQRDWMSAVIQQEKEGRSCVCATRGWMLPQTAPENWNARILRKGAAWSRANRVLRFLCDCDCCCLTRPNICCGFWAPEVSNPARKRCDFSCVFPAEESVLTAARVGDRGVCERVLRQSATVVFGALRPGLEWVEKWEQSAEAMRSRSRSNANNTSLCFCSLFLEFWFLKDKKILLSAFKALCLFMHRACPVRKPPLSKNQIVSDTHL